MLKKWKQQIYDEGFCAGRREGLSTGYHNGLQIGYERGFADASKGGVFINQFGIFICKDATHFESLTNLIERYNKVEQK